MPSTSGPESTPDFPSLAEVIRRRGATGADRVAIVSHSRSWTYGELSETSSRVAQALAAAGVGRGDCVACLTKYTAECAMLLFAAGKLGAVLAPLNWRLSARELEYVIGVSRPKVLLTDSFLTPVLRGVAMSSVRRLLVSDDARSGDSIYSCAALQADIDPGVEPSADSAAVRLFSSGTTGLPKAVDLSHEGILTHCQQWTAPFGYLEGATVHLNVLPTFHVSGLVNAVWMAYLGGTSICLPQFDPREYLAAIARYRVTDAFVVPAMLRSLLAAPESLTTDLSSLRTIAYGGSPIDEALLTQCLDRFKCGFLQVYGMTECSGTVTVLPAEDHHPGGPCEHLLRSVGMPAPHIALRIVEPLNGRACEDGQVGEVWIRSRQNMLEYFMNPEGTAAAFPEGRDAEGGWYRSGDAGYLLGGRLYLHDRVKDMIISGGENIYPAEVEVVIGTHPAVAEVAVIGVPDDRWGETPKACVVLLADRQVTGEELIGFTRARLAHYKCPTSVMFLDALPRNPSGKVLKRVLREPFWVGSSRQIG